MKSLRRRASALAAVVLACTCLVVAHNAAANWDSTPVGGFSTAQDYACGPQDNPEGPIQGDVPKADTAETTRQIPENHGRTSAEVGYNCGLALVGHATIFPNDPPSPAVQEDPSKEKTGNANMAWIGNCAFVSGPSGAVAPESKPDLSETNGVAVIDVSDPTSPKHVKTLHDIGARATSETINAATIGTLGVLVIGQYGNDQVSDPKPMDVYTLDVSAPYQCTDIRHRATVTWPENIHNLTVYSDARDIYVFATQPLQAMRINGLLDEDNTTGEEYLGNIDDVMEGPMFAVGPYADHDDALPDDVRQAQHPSYTSHEAWPVLEDGRTILYLGGQLPTFELFSIVDVTEWLAHPKTAQPDVISQRSGRGHSVRTATIGNHHYVLHSEESPFGAGFGCVPETANPFAGPSQPWLTNVDNESEPGDPVQFGLEINNPENCPEQLNSNLDDSVHYHDVDDQTDTHFVMASMWNAGLRVFSVHEFPDKGPTEVAYFNPGDVNPTATTRLDHAWGHVHYDAATGYIWFATADGGFWVVGIEDQVWSALGLPARTTTGILNTGARGTLTTTLAVPALGYVDVTPYYCTLGTAKGLNTP